MSHTVRLSHRLIRSIGLLGVVAALCVAFAAPVGAQLSLGGRGVLVVGSFTSRFGEDHSNTFGECDESRENFCDSDLEGMFTSLIGPFGSNALADLATLGRQGQDGCTTGTPFMTQDGPLSSIGGDNGGVVLRVSGRMCGDGVTVASNDNQQHVASALLTLTVVCGWGSLSGATGTLSANLQGDARGTVNVFGILTPGQGNNFCDNAQARAKVHR